MRRPYLAASIMLAAFPAVCQQRADLDLTQLAVRQRQRPPSSSSGAGSVSSGGDGAADASDGVPLRLVVFGTPKSDLRAGQDLRYSVRIENTSNRPFSLPWDPQIADMEPQDPTQDYAYLTISISLHLILGRGTETAIGAPVHLFGSPHSKGSMILLAPGEWAVVRISVLFQDISLTL